MASKSTSRAGRPTQSSSSAAPAVYAPTSARAAREGWEATPRRRRTSAASAVAELRRLGFGPDGSFTPGAEATREGAELARALSTLQTYAPTLYRHPQVLAAANEVFRRAAATAEALGERLPAGVGALPAVPTAGAGGGGRFFGVPGMGGMEPTDLSHLAAAYRYAQMTGDPAAAGLAPDMQRALEDQMLARAGRSGGKGGAGSAMQAGNPTGATPHASGSNAWAGTSYGQKDVPQGVANAGTLRAWSNQVPWLRTGINVRRDQVGRAEVAVDVIDPANPYPEETRKALQLLLSQPNEYRQNWAEFAGEVTEDLLVLDRGAITKNMTPRRQPRALYAQDGATMKIFPSWDGDPNTPRYVYQDSGSFGDVRLLRNDECIILMANPATYRFGLSPVQVLRQTLINDQRAMEMAAHVVDMRPPPHMVWIPGASQPVLDTMRGRYEMEVSGRREVWLVGGDEEVKVYPLIHSMKDNQVLEWQVYLARQICAVLRISPQQLGITMDVNKATGETQQDIFEDTGLLPLLLLWEEYLNRELVGDFAPTLELGRADLAALNLQVRFPEVSEAARIMHVEQMILLASKAMPGLPSMTPNEVRVAIGQEPVAGGDTFWTYKYPAIPWLSYDGDLGTYGVDHDTPSTQGEAGDQGPLGGPDSTDDSGDGSGDGDGNEGEMDAGANSPDGTAASSGGGEGAAAATSEAATTDGSGGDAGAAGKALTVTRAQTRLGSAPPPAPVSTGLRGAPTPALQRGLAAFGTRTPGRYWLPPTASAEAPAAAAKRLVALQDHLTRSTAERAAAAAAPPGVATTATPAPPMRRAAASPPLQERDLAELAREEAEEDELAYPPTPAMAHKRARAHRAAGGDRPMPSGIVRPHARDSRVAPRGVKEAERTLRADVNAIFEAAAKRHRARRG